MNTAYIILHGFRGRPMDVYPIRDNLINFNIEKQDIYLPLLHGHNLEKREFSFDVTFEEIVNKLNEYITQISKNYDQIVLIGYSMGSLIALCSSQEVKIDKTILLNPPIYIWDFKSFGFWFLNDIKKKRLFHAKKILESFRYKVIRNNFELRKLRHYVIDNISKTTIDTLIIQSVHDYVSNPISGKFVYDNISSKNKEIFYYNNTSHFIPSENNCNKITSDIYNWVNNN